MLTKHLSLFNFVLGVLVYEVRSSNLVAVTQVFRHGERTPMKYYPNDPFKNHWKGLEPQQVTNKGRLQLYELGQLTKLRYATWLTTKYNSSFFYAQTTDVERTHVSGQSFLYGLFPAVGDQKWIDRTDWQAIPLHIADPKILVASFSNCPAYDILYEKLLVTEDFVKINQMYSNLYKYLSRHIGENISDLHGAELVWDTLTTAAGVNLSLPEWTKTVYPEPLTTLSATYLKSLTYTTQLKRIYIGPLLGELLDYFDSMAVNYSSPVPKFKVFSAHDGNMAAILNSFGIYDEPFALHFGCSLWIELKTLNDKYFVNVWLKNGDYKDPVEIKIKGCALDCPLEQLKNILKDIAVDVTTWTDECYSIQNNILK